MLKNICTFAVISIMTLGPLGAAAQAQANPLGPDAPVCHANVENEPMPGMYITAVTGVDCRQQADHLRWQGTLQFQKEMYTAWSKADQSDLEKTYPLHQSIPLSAKCEEGYWRVMVEIWETTAGHPWHGVYLSNERMVHKSDCTEHVHIF